MTTWMTATGGEYKIPSQTEDLKLVLENLVPSEVRDRVERNLEVRPDLWVVRAVLGIGLPTPMTFEMLAEYLLETGHGQHPPEVLEEMFAKQIQDVL